MCPITPSRTKVCLRRLLVVLAWALLPAATAACAAPQPDQACDALHAAQQNRWRHTGAGIGLGIAAEAAQTFTVGVDGVLTGVEVQIFKGTKVTQKLVLEVRKTVQSAPAEKAAQIMARKAIPLEQIPAALPAAVAVDLQAYCLRVNQGEELAIVLTSTEEQSGYGWQTVGGDPYKGGERFARSRQTPQWTTGSGSQAGHDLGFKTFIDPDATCTPRTDPSPP